MHLLQPVDLPPIASTQRRVDRAVHVADDGDVDLPDAVDAAVRLDEHVAEAAERLFVGGDDLDIEQALVGLSCCHV